MSTPSYFGEDPYEKYALGSGDIRVAPNGFRLAEGEYFCMCPYDEVHIVINKRFERHLFKCKRQFEKKMGRSTTTTSGVGSFGSGSYYDDTAAFPFSRKKPDESKISSREIYVYLQKVKEIQEKTDTVGEVWEDWDMEARVFPVPTYDPRAEMEKRGTPYVQPPYGLSKSEKRAFRAEQQVKIERLYDPNDP